MNNLFSIDLVIWFKVSYAEKDNAKKLKCRWCPTNKGWYTIIKHSSLTELLDDPFGDLPTRFYVLKLNCISTRGYSWDPTDDEIKNYFIKT